MLFACLSFCAAAIIDEGDLLIRRTYAVDPPQTSWDGSPLVSPVVSYIVFYGYSTRTDAVNPICALSEQDGHRFPRDCYEHEQGVTPDDLTNPIFDVDLVLPSTGVSWGDTFRIYACTAALNDRGSLGWCSNEVTLDVTVRDKHPGPPDMNDVTP